MRRSTDELQRTIVTRTRNAAGLANELGVSRAATSQWATGRTRMTLDSAILASSLSNVSLPGQRPLTLGSGIDWDDTERRAGVNGPRVRELRCLVELCYEAAQRLADLSYHDARQALLSLT